MDDWFPKPFSFQAILSYCKGSFVVRRGATKPLVLLLRLRALLLYTPLDKSRPTLIQFTNASWLKWVQSPDSAPRALRTLVLDIFKLVGSSNISFFYSQAGADVLRMFGDIRLRLL